MKGAGKVGFWMKGPGTGVFKTKGLIIVFSYMKEPGKELFYMKGPGIVVLDEGSKNNLF